MSFTETEYVVNESDLLLEVCVSLDGATEVPVSVMLALQPDDQLSPDMMATCKRQCQANSHFFIIVLLVQLDLTPMY